jgi:hypothetical protein
MENIFEKLGKWFKPNQEEQQKKIKVIGFYASNNKALFIYNSYDDRFDNFDYIDLSEVGIKYEKATMKEAQMCMNIEGNVGDLQEYTIAI